MLKTGSTIGASILAHYGSLTAACGLDAREMLDRAGVNRRCLVDSSVPLSVERAANLIAITAQAANLDTFGIQLTLGRGLPDLGPLSLLLRQEPDLGSALTSLSRYFHVHSAGMAMRLEVQESVAVVALLPEPAATLPQAIEMIVCATLQTIRWLAAEELEPVLIAFRHSGPEDFRQHRRLLKSPVAFDHAFNGIVLDLNDLTRPVAHADAALRRHAEDYVRTIAAAHDNSLIDQVTRLVTALLPSGGCSASLAAQQLGMSRATLVRRLAEQGTSFSAIVDDLRRKLAMQACRSPQPLTRIAEQLGYADLSCFSRWFTKSFGCSPTVWRAANP